MKTKLPTKRLAGNHRLMTDSLSHAGLRFGIRGSVRLRLVYFSMLYVVILLWEFMPDQQGMVKEKKKKRGGSLEQKQKAFSGLFLIRQASTKVEATTAGQDSQYK